MTQLPWWLRPWHSYLALQAASVEQSKMIMSQFTLINELKTARTALREENARLQQKVDQLLHPVATSTPEGAFEVQPDFVMVGITRPGGAGKRLIASSHLGGTHFGMTPENKPPPRWVLEATMGEALFIDKPGYPEALAQVSVIWGNRERSNREEKARRETADSRVRISGGTGLAGGPPQIRTVQHAPALKAGDMVPVPCEPACIGDKHAGGCPNA